jgi:hypothetical protein
MADARVELYKTLDALDYHARKVTVLTTQVRALLAGMNLPPPVNPGFSCLCGRVFVTERRLAIHRQNVHDGPAVALDETELAG